MMDIDRIPLWEREAYLFAQSAHKGQQDDGGRDYFEAHILHVVEILKAAIPKDDVRYEALITAAYLHDTIEDTNTAIFEIEESFGAQVAGLVLELTHDGQKDAYGYYFPRLRSANAILVKFADRLSNLSRMDAWCAERRKQYLNKSKFWKDGTEGEPKVAGGVSQELKELVIYYRHNLRQILFENGIGSNPASDDDEILDGIRKVCRKEE
jgi:GTP pyrophosphokinase